MALAGCASRPARPVASGSTGGDHGTTIDYAKLDKAMTDSILKFPATTKGQGNGELAPKILADGTKQYLFRMEATGYQGQEAMVKPRIGGQTLEIAYALKSIAQLQ